MDDAARDEARGDIAARGLTPRAAAYLTRDALGRIELDHLAPVKKLLKQFFSDARWTADDDDALAALVGPGDGWWEHDLDDTLRLAFGWRDGAFRLEPSRGADALAPVDRAPALLAETFGGAIVPEATPNQRTIRFVTGPVHAGPSKWYESAAAVDDPRVARLFAEFDDVANVLVGPEFVAIGVRRADRWEQLLGPVLRVLEEEFPADPGDAETSPEPDDREAPRAAIDVRGTSAARPARALDRAWRELRELRLDQPDDVQRLVAAASAPQLATRQAAARLLVDVDGDVALGAWSTLLADPSATVRRATVDAMVDAARPELRPLLERALSDRDAWTRWKALRGLVDLGIEPSRDALARLVDDPDFRVRLEAAGALRRDENAPGASS